MLHTCWLLCTKGHLLSSQKISKVTKEKLFPVVLQYAFFCSHSWSKRTLCGWCVRVFVSIFISVCKPARKKIPNAHSLDDLDVHVYHCLSRKRQTKEGPSSKAIINLLSVQIWAAKTSHISAFSCCGTACSLDPDGIPQPNCILDAQLQNLGKKLTAKWSTELPSTDVVSKHLCTVGTCWNHPHAHHLRTKHTKSWVCCNML